MRIACLQFSPQVGDVDNNLNRADAVLNRANHQKIDLLVLPELAFSGYNFKSLKHITPYLEHTGSGITSLWARTTALKYDCVVVVGYPEKVDMKETWPTSPEYYNSALAVNADGETIVNYRKSFLSVRDETWALEGPDGFFDGRIGGLGRTVIGIDMDINPYKFEAPWMAWEFAYHVLHKEANLVIISMAWLTPQHLSAYSAKSKEPDMETLAYWVARLEPMVRVEDEGEIIIVLANRCGTEDDAVYAGTSCVLGIEDGEVRVYGILGRGERDLLVVDTEEPPLYNLVAEPGTEIWGDFGSTYSPAIGSEAEGAESQGKLGSIDAMLASAIEPLEVGASPRSTAEVPQENAESSVPTNKPSKPVSTGIESAAGKQEGKGEPAHPLPSLPAAIQEQSQEMVQIKPAATVRFGIPIDNKQTSTPSMTATISPEICPTKAEEIKRASPKSKTKLLSPLITRLRGPIDRPQSPKDVGRSAQPGDRHPAYVDDSAASMMVNAPWEPEPERYYYGDEELIKIMGVKKPVATKNNRQVPQLVIQPFVAREDKEALERPGTVYQLDSNDVPDSAFRDSAYPPTSGYAVYSAYARDSAYPEDSAYPRDTTSAPLSAYPPQSGYPREVDSAPDSASSMAPWKPKAHRHYYGDEELSKIFKSHSSKCKHRKRADDTEPKSAYPPSSAYPIYPPQSAFPPSAFPKSAWPESALQYSAYPFSAYPKTSSGPQSAYPQDSGSAPDSACSMMPWRPNARRQFYGDEELSKILKIPGLPKPAITRRDSPPRLSIPPTAKQPDSAEPVDSAYPRKSAYPSVTSASSMEVNASATWHPSSIVSTTLISTGIIPIMASPSVVSTNGSISTDFMQFLDAPSINTLLSTPPSGNPPGLGISMTSNTKNQEQTPANQPDSGILPAASNSLESTQTESNSPATENPVTPDSARSMMFNIPAPTPGLFPGEEMNDGAHGVSPTATRSSRNMSFTIVQPAEEMVSPMSEWSMKYSDHSPESATSMMVNTSWDNSPMFGAIEEMIKLTESMNCTRPTETKHLSLPVADRRSTPAPVSPPRERPTSPKSRNSSLVSESRRKLPQQISTPAPASTPLPRERPQSRNSSRSNESRRNLPQCLTPPTPDSTPSAKGGAYWAPSSMSCESRRKPPQHLILSTAATPSPRGRPRSKTTSDSGDSQRPGLLPSRFTTPAPEERDRVPNRSSNASPLLNSLQGLGLGQSRIGLPPPMSTRALSPTLTAEATFQSLQGQGTGQSQGTPAPLLSTASQKSPTSKAAMLQGPSTGHSLNGFSSPMSSRSQLSPASLMYAGSQKSPTSKAAMLQGLGTGHSLNGLPSPMSTRSQKSPTFTPPLIPQPFLSSLHGLGAGRSTTYMLDPIAKRMQGPAIEPHMVSLFDDDDEEVIGASSGGRGGKQGRYSRVLDRLGLERGATLGPTLVPARVATPDAVPESNAKREDRSRASGRGSLRGMLRRTMSMRW